MNAFLTVAENPKESDRQTILKNLVAFNDAAGGPSGYSPVAVLICDAESESTTGGLWGVMIYDWLFVELLFVPEWLRGQGYGTRLIQSAEQIARERNCVGVWLDTFGFQAPLFYQRLGYEIFGVLPDHPRGGSRSLLRKFLAHSPSTSADEVR